jgi:hypothetical protein
VVGGERSLGGPAIAGPPAGESRWPPGFSITQGAEAERALAALCAVAQAKDAPSAERGALGELLQTLPDRAHAAEAASFERYWLSGGGVDKPLRDVVAAYREWLEGES